MDILTFILIGLIAGWLAGIIMRGRGLGVGGDIVVGIVGALIGGYVFALFGVRTGSFLGEIAMAVVGAVILLFLISLIKRPTV